jgi:transposase
MNICSGNGKLGMRGRRPADRKALEERRLQAARLFAKGLHPAEVARRLGVSRQSTSVWYRAWEAEGNRGLKRAERAGRPPLLTEKELRQVVERALLKGPRAHGWSTELWTLQRVADVIAMETGVRYHVGHVWWIMKRLGWSWQKPARRAIERDEEAIRRWVREEWPEVKKVPAGSGPGSSSRTRREPR